MSEASEREIADLDSALAADGEWFDLRRLFGTQLIPLTVRCRAFVRNYGARDLVGGITEEQSEIIMSPTQITEAGWPGPWTPSASEPIKPNSDRRIPRKGDKAALKGGKDRNVEIVKPIYVDNELVRIEMRVLG